MITLKKLPAFVFAATFILLLVVAVISVVNGIPVEYFTRDPAAIALQNPFKGVVSNVGILFWCATAAISLFSSALLAIRHQRNGSRFLLFGGLLTSILLLDDLFMFHEEVFPHYLHFPEKGVYLGYFLLAGSFFLKFGSLILSTRFRMLAAACVLFALSIGSDALLPQKGFEFLIEDTFKLLGIVAWFVYFSQTSFLHLTRCFEPVLTDRLQSDRSQVDEGAPFIDPAHVRTTIESNGRDEESILTEVKN